RPGRGRVPRGVPSSLGASNLPGSWAHLRLTRFPSRCNGRSTDRELRAPHDTPVRADRAGFASISSAGCCMEDQMAIASDRLRDLGEPFSCTSLRIGDDVVVTIRGELDLATRGRADEVIREAEQDARHAIVIDLREL